MTFEFVCRLSVTFMYRDHIGWNSSKTISRPNSLRHTPSLTPTWAICCNGNTPKIRVEYRGWVRSTQNVSSNVRLV